MPRGAFRARIFAAVRVIAAKRPPFFSQDSFAICFSCETRVKVSSDRNRWVMKRRGVSKRELADLMRIPGVGEKTALDLWGMGLRSADGLAGRDPQELYDELCIRQGYAVDRCMLYVFRCAVYYASSEQHDPELLKWWNWKDDELRR